jgi:hypothetical protein
MRIRISWLVVLLGLGILATPREGYAQLGDVPPPGNSDSVPWPFGRPRYDQGGFYFGAEVLWWKQTNTMGNQPVAYRGFQDDDGTIGASTGLTAGQAGVWIGSQSEALNVNQVSGPTNYQPGMKISLGYRWADGIAFEINWVHIINVDYSATAGLLPPQSVGSLEQNTFVTAPVYNFNFLYNGPGNTTGLGSPTAMLGIWDGASNMTESFIQRFDQVELTMRIPIMDSDDWRTYGIMGPRVITMWERYEWTTTHPEFNGLVAPNDEAIYSNVTSNRLYGFHLGVGNEWLLSDTPIGAFSVSLDLQVGGYFDAIKGRPRYELADKSTEATHARNLTSAVGSLEGELNVWYYPYEGIVFRFGYTAEGFLGTYASPVPIDFNFGSITPAYQSVFRLFDGFNAGIGIVF